MTFIVLIYQLGNVSTISSGVSSRHWEFDGDMPYQSIRTILRQTRNGVWLENEIWLFIF